MVKSVRSQWFKGFKVKGQHNSIIKSVNVELSNVWKRGSAYNLVIYLYRFPILNLGHVDCINIFNDLVFDS